MSCILPLLCSYSHPYVYIQVSQQLRRQVESYILVYMHLRTIAVYPPYVYIHVALYYMTSGKQQGRGCGKLTLPYPHHVDVNVDGNIVHYHTHTHHTHVRTRARAHTHAHTHLQLAESGQDCTLTQEYSYGPMIAHNYRVCLVDVELILYLCFNPISWLNK